MSLSENFSMKVSNYVKSTLPDKTEDDLEIIRYGIEVLYANFAKFPIILMIAYFLGVARYAMYTIIIWGILRCFSGGIHATKSWTCLLSTLITIFTSVYLSLYTECNIVIKACIFLTSLYLYNKYSPADTEEKPYVDPCVRKRLRIKSLITVTIYFILSISLKNIFFSNIFIYILWVQGILICPVTYKIFKRRYNNYEYFK
ncbi:accessory gene regulator ArgB-like protein [Clostridium lundense]|uniref:accessory gene regulator ArgB-like protein n=1 Tax=Clostridium lundense TaxID=319475 RepID=UPI000487FCCE|nr:accessory gene regulator B family protein [Clostridium lundense]